MTINAGSSSIKFDLFDARGEARRFSGTIAGIGLNPAVPDHLSAAKSMLDQLANHASPEEISAVGHRIVHGGPEHNRACVIDGDVLSELHRMAPLDPEHLPVQLRLIEILHEAMPMAVQIACFDTAFHHDLPPESRLLPLPRRYEAEGLRRYGFHGLSYSYLMTELTRLAGAEVAQGRVVMAHLGNGASLAAVKEGQPIDTSMGLTPAGGIPMSTRSGDLDPGVAYYLMQRDNLTPDEFNQVITEQSGLLGISDSSADMKRLLENESHDERAAEAVNLFCYQVKKMIGAYAAAMGGLDALIFSGGIGEQAPKIRTRVCEGLNFLGVYLNEDRNLAGDGLISADEGPVPVWVIPANEAVTIARDVSKIMTGAKEAS